MIRSAVLLASLLAACASHATPTAPSGASIGPLDRAAGVAAFETVRGVLQHPRCQNCHPAGDVPLQGDDSHPHLQNIQRGPRGEGMVGAACTTCHGPANPPNSYGPHIPPGSAEGWHMPPPEHRLVFVGKTPKALCEQVQDPARNGGKDAAALRAHLDTPLVRWGWDPGRGRAPIPIARTTFVAAWEVWARAGAPCPD
jgi:cytochrome c5